jgi:transporter family protein
MIGVALALLSAFFFGLSQILVRRNLDQSNYVHISLTVTIMGNIVLWPIALLFTDFTEFNPAGLLLFIISGALAPAVSRLFYFKGMQTAGMATNATLFSTYPIYTTACAVLLLGETLTVPDWMGLVFILLGVISIGKSMNNSHAATSNSKTRLVPPIIGALAIASSQILRKEALNIYNQPLLGVAIGYATSLLVYFVILRFIKTPQKYTTKTLKTFWKPGVGIGVGWLLSFLALSQNNVSIVAPLLQTELLFILLFCYIFLRNIEN